MKKIMFTAIVAAVILSLSVPGQAQVVNGDFEAGVTGFTNGYLYVAPAVLLKPPNLEDGEYTVDTNPFNVHSAWAPYGDHTDGLGNMLIVNAGLNPSEAWRQTVPVIGGGEYTLTYWLSSCYAASPASIECSIQGNVSAIAILGTQADAPSVAGVWIQVSRTWTAGATDTQATIRLIDRTYVLFGDDFAIDDISFVSLCPDPGLEKEITGANTDMAVEVGQDTTTDYCFTISYSNPDGPDVLILDTVPAEWIVTSVTGIDIDEDGVSDGPQEDGNGGTINVFKAGKGKSGAKKIEWKLGPDVDCGSIEVCVTTRESPGKKNLKFAPTSCGMLCLNDGAEAYELVDGEPLPDPFWVTDPLCLVAVEDLDGVPGVVADGSGDEDEDGLTDLDEVMIYLTEPCNPDTDGDGALDGDDNYPLNPDLQ